MRQFLWKGSGTEQHHWQALVSWDIECRPTQVGGLRILNIQKMNTAVLTKQVASLVSSFDDLVTQVLKESYGKGLN